MRHFRSCTLLLLFVFAGLTLAACKKEYEDEKWHEIKPISLTAGSWRLDEIRRTGANGSTTSGDNIKDRYTLTFRNDGTYQQKIIADGTTFNGTWILMNNNTTLHLTDHKGA